MKHLQVATFKSIRDELLANTIETGAAIVQVYIPGVSEDTLCLPYRSYVKSILNEGESIENNERAKGFIISPWSGKSPDPINYIGDQEVLYEDVNFRFKSAFTTTNCSITPDQGNTLLLGSNYKATVTADANYVLDSVVVKVGGQTVQSGTNANIDLNNILGDVEITAVATLNNYTIDYVNIIDSDCVESTNTSRSIDHGLTYTTTIRKKEGYATLGPGSVTVGGVQMDSWNEQSGDKEISVVATGNIVIKVDECGDKYKYTAQLAQGLSNCVTLTGPTSNIEYGSTYRATLTHTAEYATLGAITVTMGGTLVRTYPAGETQIDLVINGVNGNIVVDGECGTQETYSITLDKDCVTLVSPASPTNIQRGSDVHITLQKGQSYLNFGPGTISSPGKETIGIPSGITEFDTIINNVEGNITINIESCGDPIPTDYPVTINWVRQSDNQIIHTETQEHVQAGTTIHPEDYENDWDFSGYTEYEIKSMNPTRGTSIVVNEPKTIIYYCGLKDVPVSKYEVEVKYVTEESGQYVSIQGPTSDYTLGEYDEGTVLISNQQNIDTSNTNDYNFFSFDPATLTVSASSKTIYVVYVPKGNHTINYYNINNNGCVTNDKGTTSDSVAEGSSYSVTLTLDTDKYISAEVTISGSFTDTITLDSANPQRTVTFTVTTDTDITATCGQDREYIVTYNHIAGLSSSTGQQIVPSPLPTDSVTYGTTITISDLDNMRLSDQELNSYGYGTYINNSGYGYNNNSAGQETALTSTFTVTEDTTIYLYYSETPQGTVVFNYYDVTDDQNPIFLTQQTVTGNDGSTITINNYIPLPNDVVNRNDYKFKSVSPDDPIITIDKDQQQTITVNYEIKTYEVTFKYIDIQTEASIPQVQDEVRTYPIHTEICYANLDSSIRKNINGYISDRSTPSDPNCIQDLDQDQTFELNYKKMYQLIVEYLNKDDQTVKLRPDSGGSTPYGTPININNYASVEISGYTYDTYEISPSYTDPMQEGIKADTTLKLLYVQDASCTPSCSLDMAYIQAPSSSYEITSSLAPTPSDIVSKLASKILMVYKYSDAQNPAFSTVSELGWTVEIPDNVVAEPNNPYTGKVIDCACNEHEFSFYYRAQPDPFINVLVGCYNLKNGAPQDGREYEVLSSNPSQTTVQTSIDSDQTTLTVTATLGQSSYSVDIPICPHFRVHQNAGTNAIITPETGADTYPWYGDTSKFTISASTPGRIIRNVYIAMEDNGRTRSYNSAPLTKNGSYSTDYGDAIHLGETYSDNYFTAEISNSGDTQYITFKDIQGDITIKVDSFPQDCLNQNTYRHLKDDLTPIPGISDSTYWTYGGVSGRDIDYNDEALASYKFK